jgi:hypothetical protein
MTGTDNCVVENGAEINCPKTANQSEKSRTIPNKSNNIKTKRNNGFNALNCKEVVFSGRKVTPSFSAQKIGATGLEPATS